jgi:HEAT repeat protein
MVIPWNLSASAADISDMKDRGDYRGLIRALRSSDIDVQWRASTALAELGTEGMDHLLSGLRTRNKDIRLGIIEALGEIRDPRAVDPLISLLADRNNEIRWEAALALGEIGDLRAIEPLREALYDPDRYVRYGAAVALENLGWSPKNAEEYAFLLAGKQDWKALSLLGNPAVRALAQAAKDLEKSVRVSAIRTLGQIGDEKAIPAIFVALRDPEDQVRWEAVMAAQKCGISSKFLPRALSKRPRTRKSPLIAGFLNFVLPGIGYFWLGKWWGVIIFQIDIYMTVWIYQTQGEVAALDVLLPVYLILAIHAWYIARQIPEF